MGNVSVAGNKTRKHGAAVRSQLSQLSTDTGSRGKHGAAPTYDNRILFPVALKAAN